MKKNMKKLLVMLLSLAIFAGSFSFNGRTAFAAGLYASNLEKLGEIVRERGLARDGNFKVRFDGTDEEWDVLLGEDMRFFYYNLIKMDDVSTSDDSDYLVGNIDFSKDFMSSEGNVITFTFDYFETSEQTEYVNENTEKILESLGVSEMSNYEKVKAVHDYVCDLITYKDDAENCSSVYSAYYTGYGLCNSYALCMYKLLTEAGVPCKWIGGKAGTGRDSDGHAWNIVKLGDQWYNLDATWDDAEGDEISYDYFLKGSSDFDNADPEQAHEMDDEYYITDYLKDFPIAETAFEEGDDDTNTSDNNPWKPSEPSAVTDDSGSGSNNVNQITLKISDVITGKYPSSGKLMIKRKKHSDIQLFIKNAAAKKKISKISYTVTSGKKYIKTKNYGIHKDGKEYFSDLRVTGKKKGNAKIKVTVLLKGGVKKSYSFTVKVK